MKLAKSLLLGSATAFVAVAGANAADLPSKKAAPVNYVKICDAYGAGFYTIPGTETCIKLGGRVRADYSFSQAKDVYSAVSTSDVATLKLNKSSQNIFGSETRGRVDLDARTPTPYGTVQAVTSLRMARTTGVLNESAVANDGLSGDKATNVTINSSGAGATLEAAYIRFAGFTFGNARDNFSFMPSIFYGSGHWASFANGSNGISYTAVLGGGVSVTLGFQDPAYTAGKPLVDKITAVTSTNVYASYRSIPQLNARLDWDQSWGSVALKGALNQYKLVDGASTAASIGYDKSKTVWAIGAGAKINLPQLAAGDALWLDGGYADGMTEYTINWGSFKSSDTKRNAGGYVFNPPSIVAFDSGISSVKSWNVAAVFQHWFAPQHRTSFLASYGAWKAPDASKNLVWNAKSGFGDGTTWNVGAQYAFVPTSNFEIGVEALYNRVKQDVAATTNQTTVYSKSDGGWTGRMRVERTF
jgi:hypothetical protein